MAQVQEIWNKLNPRERLTGIGALLIILGWIVGLTARGLGIGSLGLLGAVAVLVVLYLKYANPDIKWPIAVSLIVLAVAAIVALGAVLNLLDWFAYLGILGISGLLALALYVIGALLMVWGAWQEYQVEKPALPNMSASSTSSAPPAAAPPPTAAPPPASAAPAAPAEAPPHRSTGRFHRNPALGASADLEQLERRHDLGTPSRHHTGRAELTARPRHVCRADRRATMLRRT